MQGGSLGRSRLIALAVGAMLMAGVSIGPSPVQAATITSCTYSAGVVRLVLASHHVIRLLAVQGRIDYADLTHFDQYRQCGRATVRNTDRIRISEAVPGTSRLQFDQQLGRFGPGRTRESSGVSEIEVQLGTLTDIWIMGRSIGERVIIGRRGVNLNRDGDVDLVGSSLTKITLFLNDGDDHLDPRGGHGTGDGWAPPRSGYLLGYGDDGQDVLIGTRRRDILDGEGDNDRLNGRGGNDELRGGNHSDAIVGGAGNDYIVAGSWPDAVRGGPGDDFIDGRDLGPDDLRGGTGFDRALIDPVDSTLGIESVSLS